MKTNNLRPCPKCKHGHLRISQTKTQDLKTLALNFKCNNCSLVLTENIGVNELKEK